jgi:hypothetical protein
MAPRKTIPTPEAAERAKRERREIAEAGSERALGSTTVIGPPGAFGGWGSDDHDAPRSLG